VSLIPWKSFGAHRVSRLFRWLPIPVIGLAIIYEWAMPSRFDIRVDLFLLLPAYAVVIISSLVRWLGWRHAIQSRKRSHSELPGT